MCGIAGLLQSRQQSCVPDEASSIEGWRNDVTVHGAPDR